MRTTQLSSALRLALIASIGITSVTIAKEDDASKTSSSFWTAREQSLIEEGLSLVNATREDLCFEKQPIDDRFRLPVVARALSKPLSVGKAAKQWDETARSGSLDDLMLLSTVQLFRKTYFSSAVDVEFPKAREALPKALGAAWQDLLETVHWAKRSFRGIDLLGDKESRKQLLKKALAFQCHDGDDQEGALSSPDFLKKIESVKRLHIAGHGQAIALATRDLVNAVRALPPEQYPTKSQVLEEQGLTIRVGGMGYDHHDKRADIVIDFGGNDRYDHGAAANGFLGEHVSVAIDVAGDDTYAGKSHVSMAGALGGVAVQWDMAGDDVYRAPNCSLGAGVVGVAALVDDAGNDVYHGGDFCLGAGAFGMGFFIDRAGNDTSHADFMGQGCASTWGCGVLVDLSGNDQYSAGKKHVHAPLYRDRYQALSQGFAIGMRPLASGGIGVLVDAKGNDTYVTDIYGQGSSYWYSLGLLIDNDGHDSYVGTHYCQGAGIHLSAGMLLDRAGNDHYHCINGVGIGGAHDFAVGFLIDRGGDDHYSGSGGSQGGALTNSVAMLIDTSGNDAYTAKRPYARGSSRPARRAGGIGLLLDGGGKDIYSEPSRDDGLWLDGSYGAGIDAIDSDKATKEGNDGRTSAISKEDAKQKLLAQGQVERDGTHVWDLDKLWAICSEWEVGDNRVIMPLAREQLFALGQPALDRAFDRIATDNSLEYLAVKATLKHFDIALVAPRLLEASMAQDAKARKRAIAAMEHLKHKSFLPRLEELLETDPVTRRNVLMSLTALKHCPAGVHKLLKSKDELAGVAAAGCLASAPTKENIAALIAALDRDTPYLARTAAVHWLTRVIDESFFAVVDFAKSKDASSMALRNAFRVLGNSKKLHALWGLRRGFEDKRYLVRLTSIRESKRLLDTVEPPKGQNSATARWRSQRHRWFLTYETFEEELKEARENERHPPAKRLYIPPTRSK